MKLGNVDISSLPKPSIIQDISYESIYQSLLEQLHTMLPNTELLASDPLIKLIEAWAYRELLLRKHVNDMAMGVLLAKSQETELAYLAARLGLARKVLQVGDASVTPPVVEILEPLDEFRERVEHALEQLTTAGSQGAYYVTTLSAHPDVVDASIRAPSFEAVTHNHKTITLTVADDAGLADPMPGDVAVTILMREAADASEDDALLAVHHALNADDVRPMTDNPIVRLANKVPVSISLSLTIDAAFEPASVIAHAREAVQQILAEQHVIGATLYCTALVSAARVAGVLDVELISPTDNVICDQQSALHITQVVIQ